MCACWTADPRMRLDFAAIRQQLALQLETVSDEYSYLKLDASKDYYNVSYGELKEQQGGEEVEGEEGEDVEEVVEGEEGVVEEINNIEEVCKINEEEDKEEDKEENEEDDNRRRKKNEEKDEEERRNGRIPN